MNYKFILILIFSIGLQSVFAQGKIESFLTPSDTLNLKRQNAVFTTQIVTASATLLALNQLWYKDYPKSDFHFLNDNGQWLQMDKAGHIFSAYHVGRVGAEMLEWSGSSVKNQRLYGATLGFAFLTAVEVMDGFSAEWGASYGDIIANASGTALFISQDLLWNEQRIIPKFSYHQTVYPSARPNTLGSTWNEQILKDYNGQTYWLSAHIASFVPSAKVPKWLNLAVGYGAEGMITGDAVLVNSIFLPETKRIRQFYLSLDVDLTKIQTKNHTLKTLFSLFNTIKIPAPSLEVLGNGRFKWHAVYF
ncbi:DUF2279 domain-containing protein [Flavobacterium antarcticum]|uniref:DUF2279 domain-containing protein n=1 Tax=Flavobacterium antarcticum TaxID=271155 RepID=UPI0003B4E3CE|nr:DUF2279 domain-containing protein [Flavobacterium antarcticum]